MFIKVPAFQETPPVLKNSCVVLCSILKFFNSLLAQNHSPVNKYVFVYLTPKYYFPLWSHRTENFSLCLMVASISRVKLKNIWGCINISILLLIFKRNIIENINNKRLYTICSNLIMVFCLNVFGAISFIIHFRRQWKGSNAFVSFT